MAARTDKFGGAKTTVNKVKRLTARAVAALSKPGRHADGGNLYLKIDPSGARRWVFMFARGGCQREAGLGSANAISLAKARELAAAMRESLALGNDPLAGRAAERRARAAQANFGQCADVLLAAKSSAWRNEKHRAQWRMTLEKYAAPLRPLPVAEITTQDILKVLEPIWRTKPETASRLRGRIEAVFDSARTAGHIDDRAPNPARWAGHLETILPKPTKLSRGHHTALPCAEIPKFIGALREAGANSMAALALEFVILTAARSGEVLGAQWEEIDIVKGLWTVPTARMKAAREHRVPLSSPALSILEKLAEGRRSKFVFPGQRADRPLSSMSMKMVLRRMKIAVTVHGFRSAFRDWCGDHTEFPREIAEAALAHAIGDKVEQAYRRGDALDKRRALMDAWAAFCEPTK